MSAHRPCRGQRSHRAHPAAIAFGLLVLTALGGVVAEGADRFWITTTGGQFGLSPNWSATSGGIGGATVPTTTDVAIFELGNTYTVTFTTDITNQTLRVADGNVTFNLGGNVYTLNTGISQVGTLVGETGQLNLQHGTLDVTGTGLRVGESSGRTGILNVGVNSHLITNGLVGLSVGSSGVGTVNITGGGTAATSVLTLGTNGGSQGTMTVSGLGSALNATGAMTIGGSGLGALTVSSGGQVTAGSLLSLGQTGGAGTLTITGVGSQFTHNGSQFNLGAGGQGTLNVTNGGTLETNVSTIFSNGGGNSTATVTGAGSTWNSATSLSIGSTGVATLNVTNGGLLNALNLNLGTGAGGSGTVVVGGAGATVNATNAVVGLAGGTSSDALLKVDAGGLLNLTGTVTLNDPTAGTATLHMAGGTVYSTGFTRNSGILKFDDGLYVVSGAGKTFDAALALNLNGADFNDLPTLRLTSGASLGASMAGTTITVGDTRGGALELTSGATANVGGVRIGAQGTGSGSVSVTGNGTQLNGSYLAVGGTNLAAGGTGSVTIGPGGTVTANGTTTLYAGGSIALNGGTLTTQSISPLGGSFAFNAGTVNLTTAFAPTSATYDALLGAGHQLGFGKTLNVNGLHTLGTSLNVAGGTLSGTAFTGAAGGILTLSSGQAAFSGDVTLNAGSRVYQSVGVLLSTGSQINNAGEITLQSPQATITGSANFVSSGIVQGTGRIENNFTNLAAGNVRVAGTDRLVFAGAANNNFGRIDLNNGGEVEFLNASTNQASTGVISGRNGTLRFGTGSAATQVTNAGSMTFSNGTMDVYGDIANSASGKIIVSGGGNANFYDDVVNSGVMQVSAAGTLQSTAVFFGSLSGLGVAGGGHVFIEGDARPGFSPAEMAFGGDLTFGPLAGLDLELGGLAPGSQFDTVTVVDTATLDGELDVVYISGFAAAPGDSFVVVDAGILTGAFSTINFPDAQAWYALYDYSGAGTLTIGISPVPEPSALALAGLALLGAGWRLRRYKRADLAMKAGPRRPAGV